MKKLLAYLLLIPWAIRSSYLTAYRQSMEQKKIVFKPKPVEFFKTKIKAVGEANRKATEHGVIFHVVEPAPDKFVAVSEKFLRTSELKSIYQTV